MEKMETESKEAKSARSEAKKYFIANFHLTEAYQNFAKYWRRYAYTEVVGQIEANFQTFNTSDLRSEFLEEGEKPQTPAKKSHVIEIKDKAREEKAKVQEVAPNAIIHFVPE